MEKNILKEASLKSTKKRNIILKIVSESNSPVTAEYIHEKSEIKMSLSTVYRALNVLCEKNIIEKNIHQNGIAYFSMTNKVHRHSIICTLCNKRILLESCPIASLENEISQKTGCIITGHNLEFFGICPECIKNMGNIL